MHYRCLRLSLLVADCAADDGPELSPPDHLVGEIDEVPRDLPDAIANAAIDGDGGGGGGGGGAAAAAAVGALIVEGERVAVL